MAKEKCTVQEFEDEIIKFITDHRYTKEQDADPQVDKSCYDEVKIRLHTVDGAYERIGINIVYIA